MATGVQITGLIEPLNGGAFPVFEDINGLGGFRAVPSSADRLAIPANSRKIGMVVVEQDALLGFQLQGGILDANWKPYAYIIIQNSDGTNFPPESIIHFSNDFSITDDSVAGATRIAFTRPPLPAVTTADNGDTLGVQAGLWQVVPRSVIRLTGQVAAIAPTNIFAALPGAGLYRISAYLDVTTAGTSGSTLATRVNFTPDDGVASFSIVTSAVNIGSLGGSAGQSIVETAGAAQITYEVDLVGAIGTGVYSLRLVAELLSYS